MSYSATWFFGRCLLPTAAVLIIAACWWKLTAPPVSHSALAPIVTRGTAPSFELYDQNSRLCKLEAYLHRHDIVLVFFDPDVGPDGDRNLQQLQASSRELKRNGVIVIGVSTALPQENRRRAGEDFPFSLLTELQSDAAASAMRQWGCLIDATAESESRVKPALFHIDRLGTVAWRDNGPIPEDDVAALVERLVGE
jgi:peroxiredoxin